MYVGDIEIVEKNTSLVVALFFFTILGIFCVTLRVITRLWLVRNLGLDDVFIVFATLSALGFLIAVMEQIRYGLGDVVGLDILIKFIQATVASVLSYSITGMMVKLSISIQCLRIFTTQTAKRIFIGFIVFHALFGLVQIFMTIFTCNPVAKYWDDSIEGKCIDSRILRYTFAGINILNDILLLLSPMPFLKNLQIARRAKYVLMGVFACGVFACVVAIIRLYSLYKYSQVTIPERPIVGVDIALWSGLEINTAILCACVPALKPLFVKMFPRLMSLTQASKQRNTSRYGHSSLPDSSNRTAVGQDADIEHHVDGKGIQVQQSFEMKAVAASDNDDDSEKDLVTGNNTAWRAECYPGGRKDRLPLQGRQ